MYSKRSTQNSIKKPYKELIIFNSKADTLVYQLKYSDDGCCKLLVSAFPYHSAIHTHLLANATLRFCSES